MTLTYEPQGLQWSLPAGFEVTPDELKVRLDFYRTSVAMFIVDKGVITTRMVSARDVAAAFMKETPVSSGLLTPRTLWWEPNQVALWEAPQIWQVALTTEAFAEPRRFKLPMPGLIFVCKPGRPPRVVAAKKRPVNINEPVFHAPLFNIYADGNSCAGTHKYPLKVEQIPQSFFTSFFAADVDVLGRSKKYPDDLLKLWEELNGKKKYPLDDLMPCGALKQLMGGVMPSPIVNDDDDGDMDDLGDIEVPAEEPAA